MARIPVVVDGNELGSFETKRGYVAGDLLRQAYQDASKDLKQARRQLRDFNIRRKGKGPSPDADQHREVLSTAIRRAEQEVADVERKVRDHKFD